MIEKITHGKDLIAIIISRDYKESGIHFFTPNDLSQQLAHMKHPAGKIIEPHVHNPVPREVHYTQEVLFIRGGKVRVDLYNAQQEYLESRILNAGDTVLFATGGHGFEMLEETDMIEVKQGPYAGEADKTRFNRIDKQQINLITKKGAVNDVVETKL